MPTAENLNPPVLLTKDHDRNSFDYGVPVLNDYLKSMLYKIRSIQFQ